MRPLPLYLALAFFSLLSCAPKPISTSSPPQVPPPAGLGPLFNQPPFDNRRILERPPIRDNTQKTGKVLVEICLSRRGKVISAEYIPKGSTTSDEHLIQLALDNVRQWRFEKGTEKKQCGSITFNFMLQ